MCGCVIDKARIRAREGSSCASAATFCTQGMKSPVSHLGEGGEGGREGGEKGLVRSGGSIDKKSSISQQQKHQQQQQRRQ